MSTQLCIKQNIHKNGLNFSVMFMNVGYNKKLQISNLILAELKIAREQ